MRRANFARPLTTIAACSALLALGLVGASTPASATACGSGAMTLTVTITEPTVVEIALSGTVTNITIDWGGPGYGPVNAPEVVSHPYLVAGKYTISISGDKLGNFGQPGGPALSGASAITGVTNWGALGLEGLNSAFLGATNLTSVPTCLPSTVSDLSNTFNGATAFNQSVASWDTSNVTTMSGMFNGASTFDQDLASWSVGSVTDMGSMLVGSAISADHMDAILDIDHGWASQVVQPNVLLGSEVVRSSRASSVAGFDKLRAAPYNWRFNDFMMAVAPTGAVGSVVGNAWVGTALTASGTVDNYSNSRPTWLYQWQSSATGTSGWTNIAQATKGSFTVPASQLGKHLRARVTASNGEGTVSDIVVVPSVVIGAPSAPRRPAAFAKSASVKVAWVAPLSTGGASLSGYVVTASPKVSGIAKTCAATAVQRSCTVLGLTNGRSYTFTVRASNVVGRGAASVATGAVIAGSPTAPRSLTVSFPSAKSAKVKWAAPASVGSGAVSGYRVRWCPVGRSCAPWVNLANSARSATVTGRAKGTKYRVDVQAKNGSGFSATASKTFTQGE